MKFECQRKRVNNLRDLIADLKEMKKKGGGEEEEEERKDVK